MGSIDTLEVKSTLASPPRLALYAHRQGAEFVCPIDQGCFDRLSSILSEDGASFWLRSVSRQLVPFLFWTRYKNYALVLRVKHGASRREITVPCSQQTGQSLLAFSLKEWSDAA